MIPIVQTCRNNLCKLLIWFAGKMKGLGGYSEYTLADEELCFKLPPNIPPEEAVTVPLAVCTAYLGLFSPGCLNIDRKAGPETSILIWGASCKTFVLPA